MLSHGYDLLCRRVKTLTEHSIVPCDHVTYRHLPIKHVLEHEQIAFHDIEPNLESVILRLYYNIVVNYDHE